MLFKKNELKLLWPFYLCYLLFGLSAIIMPYMVIYFQKLGFSFLQISIITVATGIGMFLFEIPTGVVADIFSRKYSVIIGYFLSGTSVFLIPFFINFYVLVLLMLICGIGLSFISGAEESWIIDNLNYCKRKDLQHEYFLKRNILSAFGLFFALLVGPTIAKTNSLSLLWIIFSISFFINVAILLFFAPEKYIPKRLPIGKGMIKSMKNTITGFKIIRKNKVLLLLVLAGVFEAWYGLGANAEQPLLVQLSLPTYALGYVYALTTFFVVILSILSRYFIKYSTKKVIIIITLIRTLILFSIIFIYPPLFILASLIFILEGSLFNLADPLLQTYFHKNLNKKFRATVVSTKSMIKTFMTVIVGILGGILLDVYPYQTVIALGALAGIFIIATYIKLPN